MGKKRRVDKRDSCRMLRTEVLPFETPLFFSNERFYKAVKSEILGSAPELIKNILLRTGYTVPLSYRIRKDEQSERTISLMHPSAQVAFIDFYKNYDTRITYLCRKSPCAVRAPVSVASYYYEPAFATWRRKLKSKSVEATASRFEPDEVYASSYFRYGEITHLYKFYESDEYRNLERKYSNLVQFDVSRCFENIYTHSISWAVKDKYFSKANKEQKESFEAKFDSLMQRSNYNETNGILIGSEISRIFAEIILQRIDLDLLADLKEQGVDSESFSVRRYVDDYFVFSDSAEIGERIYAVARMHLERYKMFVNEKKTRRCTRPFLSATSVAKRRAREVVASGIDQSAKAIVAFDFMNASLSDIDKLTKKINRLAPDLIAALGDSCSSVGVGLDTIASYVLSSIARNIHRYGEGLTKVSSSGGSPVAEAYVLAILDVAFYIFTMDRRAYTCYLLCQTIVLTHRLDHSLGERTGAVQRDAVDRLVRSIRDLVRAQQGAVELANLVVALSAVSDEFELSELEVARIVGGHVTTEGFDISSVDYFGMMTALRYIEREEKYSVLCASICKEICKRIGMEGDPGIFCDRSLMFIDFVSCPHVDRDTKWSVVEQMHWRCMGRAPQPGVVGQITNFVVRNLGFTEWSKGLSIEQMLERKALKVAY